MKMEYGEKEIYGAIDAEISDLLILKKNLLGLYKNAIDVKDDDLLKKVAYELAFVSYGIDKKLQDILEIEIVNEVSISPLMDHFKKRYGIEPVKKQVFDMYADKKAQLLEELTEAYCELGDLQLKLENELEDAYCGNYTLDMKPSAHMEAVQKEWSELESKRKSPKNERPLTFFEYIDAMEKKDKDKHSRDKKENKGDDFDFF